MMSRVGLSDSRVGVGRLKGSRPMRPCAGERVWLGFWFLVLGFWGFGVWFWVLDFLFWVLRIDRFDGFIVLGG